MGLNQVDQPPLRGSVYIQELIQDEVTPGQAKAIQFGYHG